MNYCNRKYIMHPPMQFVQLDDCTIMSMSICFQWTLKGYGWLLKLLNLATQLQHARSVKAV